jgi:translation initiation factor 5B
MIRQPILSVLGHIDHGKTTLLDYIRGSTVAEREAGRITQHIGATEIPLDKIYDMCGPLVPRGKLEIPGLLFIDTPGHRAFNSLRERGGAIADLAILVVDINEGVMEQTKHSIEILRRHKTPFVIAANKIDLIDGWSTAKVPFILNYPKQSDRAKEYFDSKFYKLLEQFYDLGVPCDRYENITDFTKTFAIVPVSAKSGEGIADLLATIVGLAQRFFRERLEIKKEAGEGSILEVKEEKSLGMTINAILYDGVLKRGDRIAIAGMGRPVKTVVKALFLPQQLGEMRDRKTKYAEVDEVRAACGVKIVLQDDVSVMSGVPFKAYKSEKEIEELSIRMDTAMDSEGVIIKADAIGSIEGIIFEIRQIGRRVRKADVGDVSKRDVMDAASSLDEKEKVILAFNVRVLEEAREEADRLGVYIFESNLVYDLVESYESFCQRKEKEEDEVKRSTLTYPTSIEILPGYVFHVSKPAVVGIRVLCGALKPGIELINDRGESVGKVMGIQSSGKSLTSASADEEVAMSVDKAVVGKSILEGETLYSNIDEKSAKILLSELSGKELECLNKIIEIKRAKDPFWAV